MNTITYDSFGNLLGQTDAIGRADAVRQLQNDPDANRLASTLVERLHELAPDAKLPDLPTPRQRRRIPRPTPTPADDPTAPSAPAGHPAAPGGPAGDPAAPGREAEEAAGNGSGLSGGQQRAIVIAGAAAVLIVAIVLGVTGAFGGGDDDSDSGTASAGTTASEGGDVLAEIPLEPQGGSDASGEATFGIADQDQPYLDVQLSELSAPQAQSSYVVWLLLDQQRGYPLTPIEIDGSAFSDRITIPQFAIPLAGRARFVDISLSENRSLLNDLREAVQDRKPILPYQGDSVLRGEIPAAARGGGGGGGSGGGGGGGGN